MRRLALIPMLAVALAIGTPASAQSTDPRYLYDRIDRLERDIQMMQAQMARGGASASTVVTSPALGGAPHSASTPLSPGMASRLDDRVDQLEESIRQLTGKIEEANYKAAQNAKQLERMQADLDLRFKELQGGGAAPSAAAAPAAAPGAIAAAGGKAPVPLPKNSADGDGPAPGPQNLGVLSEKDAKAAQPKPGAAPAAPVLTPPAQLAGPQAIYDDAYGKIQRGDYAGAESGFKGFLAKYPGHQLASSAQYWLGDLAYTRKDYREAVSLFGEGLQKYPKSGKRPEMWLKLSKSFANIDPPMKSEACKALQALFNSHPDMPDRVRREATADKQKLACK